MRVDDVDLDYKANCASFHAGYLRREMMNKFRMTEFFSPHLLLVDGMIDSDVWMNPILMEVSERREPLVIVCSGMSNEVTDQIVLLVMRNIAAVAVVVAPGFFHERIDVLNRIAEITGSRVWKENELDIDALKAPRLLTAEIYAEKTILKALGE